MMISEITACWRGKVTICVFRCRVFQCVRKYKAVLILQVFFSRRLKKSLKKQQHVASLNVCVLSGSGTQSPRPAAEY